MEKSEVVTTETAESVTEPAALENVVVVHICQTKGCGKPAALACPTCLKLGLPPCRFCGQDCFKANWEEHKAVHKVILRPPLYLYTE